METTLLFVSFYQYLNYAKLNVVQFQNFYSEVWNMLELVFLQ